MEGHPNNEQFITQDQGGAEAMTGDGAPTQEKKDRYRVYVANLPPRVSADTLKEEFNRLAPVVGILMANNEKYAFIDFESAADADRVVAEMNSFVLNGFPLKVELGKNDKRRGERTTREERRRTARTKNRIVVTGLNPSTSWQDLKDVMRSTGGDVTFTSVNKNCEGFAEFATDSDVERAIEKLNESDIAGYRVQVRRDDLVDRDLERDKPANRRDDRRRRDEGRRRRQRSRSPPRRHRGRSRDRRRSRSRRSPDDRSRRHDRERDREGREGREQREGGGSGRGRRRDDSASSASSRSPRRRRGSRSD